jgi:hypothetical protein
MPHEIITELAMTAVEIGAEIGSDLINKPTPNNGEKNNNGCFILFLIITIGIGYAIYYFNN